MDHRAIHATNKSWFNKSALLKEEPVTKFKKSSSMKSKEVVKKVKWLRETRDYSFLSSDSCEITNPGPGNKAEIISRPREGLNRNFGRVSITTKAHAVSRVVSGKTLETSKEKAKIQKSIVVSKQSRPKGQCSRADERKGKLDSQERGDVNAIRIIRKMFGYDPTKFRDDKEKDVMMEAGFHDIQKEERRSGKISKKEDAEELRKLVGKSKG